MANTAYPVNPQLTALAMAWRNPAVSLIADEVLPRVATAKKFSYTEYDQAQGFTVPNTLVGRKSEPVQVSFTGKQVTDEVLDYGLDDVVPNDEIEAYNSMPKPATGGPMSPEQASALYLESLIQLDREVRVAGLIFAAANYAAGQSETLSGNSQWSDYANSNPLSYIMAALDKPLIRPNVAVLGQLTYTALRQHPKIVQAVYGSDQGAGTVTRQQLADLLEVQTVLVGSSFVNTARKGQTPVMARTWGKHAAFLYIDKMAAETRQPTFGFTAQWGGKQVSTIPEPKAGLRGSVRVRNGESVKELICAPGLGYFVQNAVA